MAFLLFNPDPRAALLIGLGGGSLAKYFYHRLPLTRTVAVEVNPRVIAVARQFFHVPPDDERLRIIIGDAAAHLKNDLQRVDVIMLDGYDSEAQVEELSTLSFYRDCARVLGDAGILVVNLWGGDRNFTACVQRLSNAFNHRVACMPAGKPGNVVALAFRQSPGRPRWEELRRRAQSLEAAFGLEFTEFVAELAAMNTLDKDGLLL